MIRRLPEELVSIFSVIRDQIAFLRQMVTSKSPLSKALIGSEIKDLESMFTRAEEDVITYCYEATIPFEPDWNDEDIITLAPRWREAVKSL